MLYEGPLSQDAKHGRLCHHLSRGETLVMALVKRYLSGS